MDAATIYQRFVERAPAAVLVHGLLDSCLSPAFLDATAGPHLPASPNPRQLAFSHLVEILPPVVFESKKSVGQSDRDATHPHPVATSKCVYERLAATPTAAVDALAAAVAERVRPLLDPHPPGTTPFLTLDGNHLAATQNRLADLAGLPAALPGQAMVLRDQATGVFLRVPSHDDGHANERSLHPRLLDWFGPGDVVIADSGFRTEAFPTGVRERGAGVIARHHGAVGLTPLGERRECGRVATGRVYETRVRYARTQWEFRLVEVESDRPTRDGRRTIRVPTDVSEETLSAAEVATKDLERRTIESAFRELAEGLRGEVETLAYPKAALFAFGLAVSVYDLLRVVRRASGGRGVAGRGVAGVAGPGGEFVRGRVGGGVGREPANADGRLGRPSSAGVGGRVGGAAGRDAVREEQTRPPQETASEVESGQRLAHRHRENPRTATKEVSMVTAVGSTSSKARSRSRSTASGSWRRRGRSPTCRSARRTRSRTKAANRRRC